MSTALPGLFLWTLGIELMSSGLHSDLFPFDPSPQPGKHLVCKRVCAHSPLASSLEGRPLSSSTHEWISTAKPALNALH